MSDTPNVLSPETVLKEMKQNGVTDVVWLPDSETNWLFLFMESEPENAVGRNTAMYFGLRTRGGARNALPARLVPFAPEIKDRGRRFRSHIPGRFPRSSLDSLGQLAVASAPRVRLRLPGVVP